MKWKVGLLVGLMMLFVTLTAQAEDCAQATQLVTQAYDLGQDPSVFPEQKQVLHRALQLCPGDPQAHNNLAVILEEEQDYPQALAHYQEAVRLKPDLAEAWFGIGEVYSKTGKFALSLEAYVNACRKDQDARRKIEELLASGKYRAAEAGELLDRGSLTLLFDQPRLDAVNAKLRACGFDLITRGGTTFRAYMEPTAICRNILFETGAATLQPESRPQLTEISAALLNVNAGTVIISGHTDKQPFKGCSQEESDRKNMQLSKDRAETVAQALAALGVPRSRIETYGYGPTQPLVAGDTPEAYAQNRRVTIEHQ